MWEFLTGVWIVQVLIISHQFEEARMGIICQVLRSSLPHLDQVAIFKLKVLQLLGTKKHPEKRK